MNKRPFSRRELKDGPPGHLNLKDFGRNGPTFSRLWEGIAQDGRRARGFVADAFAEVDAA
ncbi:MAG TPA: hypothetical protein VEA61_11125 [Allosphingosinicella sp.]|nr:hypothetical protein [Allosphingosinicella sp.]